MRRATFLFAWAAAGVCAAAQPQARIELLPQVQVEGEVVILGQVAHVTATDLGLIRQLVELPLGRSPRAGESGVLRRDALMDWVRRRTGADAQQLQWQGAEEAQVSRTSQPVPGERIAQAAVAGLRAWLAGRGATAEVQVRAVPRDLQVPAGALLLQAREPAASVLRPHMQLWVDVWVGDSLARSVPVLLQVEGAADSAMLAPRRRDAEAPAAVARGEWADLHTTAGAVSLESRVEVLQDGRIGDKVRVRTRGATGLVFARVLAPGQLELAP